MQSNEVCMHCRLGRLPVKLRRQWVHHFPHDGSLVVCVEAGVKPRS